MNKLRQKFFQTLLEMSKVSTITYEQMWDMIWGELFINDMAEAVFGDLPEFNVEDHNNILRHYETLKHVYSAHDPLTVEEYESILEKWIDKLTYEPSDYTTTNGTN